MSIYIVTFRVLSYLFTVQKVNVGKRLKYGEVRDNKRIAEIRDFDDPGSDLIFHTGLN